MYVCEIDERTGTKAATREVSPRGQERLLQMSQYDHRLRKSQKKTAQKYSRHHFFSNFYNQYQNQL